MIDLIGGWFLFGTQELWILLGILIVVAARHTVLAWIRRRRHPLPTGAGPDDPVVHVARDEAHHVTLG
jgi:uncharacterized iron-regulated membrane protein